MAAVGGKIFHYEYKAEKEKLLRVWVERYEYGNLVEQAGDIGGIIENEEGEILVYFLENLEWEHYYLRSAIINETGHSMSSSHISKPGETLEAGSWSSIVSDKVPLTEDVVLGYMGLFEAHDGSSISVRTSQSPPQELVEENTHIPVLYLIRASLTDDTDLDVE